MTFEPSSIFTFFASAGRTLKFLEALYQKESISVNVYFPVLLKEPSEEKEDKLESFIGHSCISSSHDFIV